jgi:hypothetical protein
LDLLRDLKKRFHSFLFIFPHTSPSGVRETDVIVEWFRVKVLRFLDFLGCGWLVLGDRFCLCRRRDFRVRVVGVEGSDSMVPAYRRHPGDFAVF